MKKLFLTIHYSLFTIICIYAFPAGVTPFIAPVSGEFVYYRDTTFDRESYVGFLFYDEGTISVRYYAPAIRNVKPLKPAKDIEILFTLDVKKDFTELTGERILSVITPDDTEIVNYIHDMVYELSGRRKKAGDVLKKMTVRQDFMQFGGQVNVEFDPLVPLFNVRGIIDVSGKKVFTLVTAGQLVSGTDRSFSEFFGFSRADENTKKLKLQKNAKIIEYEYEGKNLALDVQWMQSMDNLWLLGNDAILTMNVINLETPAANPNAKKNPAASGDSNATTKFLSLCKKLTLGTENSYPKIESQTITFDFEKKDRFEISNIFYQPVTGALTRDFKVLERTADGKVRYFALTVFNHAYVGNEAYFKKILDSF